MEKPPRSKGNNKILNFLAKSTSFSVHLPRNPSRDHPAKLRSFHNKGFSGLMIPLVPAEVRQKEKSDIPFETQEPTSPEVSCMGQIKHRSKNKKNKKKLCRYKSNKRAISQEKKPIIDPLMQRMFRNKSRSKRISDESKSSKQAAAAGVRAPAIGQMRRFKSGRESLRDFDWREVERKVNGRDHGDEYDGERESDDDDDEIMLAYSAPLVLGGGLVAPEPRKEVNLWKRRTMSPPPPLRLSSD